MVEIVRDAKDNIDTGVQTLIKIPLSETYFGKMGLVNEWPNDIG